MPNIIKTVNFGTQRSGLATVAYTLISTDGSTKQARTTTGVAEVAADTGIYYCLITFEAAWEGIILWDDGQATKRYAADTYLKVHSVDEIADQVWDEDITGHVTADTAGHRLVSIFKYVRAPGFGGGAVIAKQVGALTDEDKEKIFKWFNTLLNRLKLLQGIIESSIDATKISLTETGESLKHLDNKTPEIDQIAQRIVPAIARSREISLSEFATISDRLKDNINHTILQETNSRILQSTNLLKDHSKALFEKVQIKENTWEDLKIVIREQNNTEQILSTMRLFFSDSHKLKEKLDDLLFNVLKEAKLSNDILKGVGAQIQKDLSLSRIEHPSGDGKHTFTLISSIDQIKTKIQKHLNNNRRVILVTATGRSLPVPTASGPVESAQPADVSFKEKPKEEGYPAVFKQNGIIIVPPHGRWIWEGRKKLIIKSKAFVEHIGEPLYLLSGKFAWGIIKLKKPKKISYNEFQSLRPKHLISEMERRKWWPFKKEFFAYDFDLVRKWDEPRKWKVVRGPQVFVKDVKFEDIEFAKIKEDEPTREESVRIEMKRFGDWYLVRQPKGKDFKYVVQAHIRGDSAHLDLRMEANRHLVGVTLNTPEVAEGEKRPQKDLIETKANKFLYPRSPALRVDYQILTQLKLVQPKIWLKVHGKIPPGGIGATKYLGAEFIIVSTGTMRFGTQKTDFHEWFLKPDGKHEWDKNIKGRWIHSWIPRPKHYIKAGEGKMMWAFFKSLKETPYIEYHKFEKEKAKAFKEKVDMVWQGPDGEEFQVVAGKGNLTKELK